MTEITYTEADLLEFDHASMDSSSRDQVRRIDGRLKISALVRQHGAEKCDAMFAEILRREKQHKTTKRQRKTSSSHRVETETS